MIRKCRLKANAIDFYSKKIISDIKNKEFLLLEEMPEYSLIQYQCHTYRIDNKYIENKN